MFLDLLLLGLWNNFYYSYGIPVFKRTFAIQNLGLASDKISKFVESLGQDECFPSFKGKTIDENKYFIRNKLVQFSFIRKSNAGVMHGNIKIDSEERTVTITAFMNLYWLFILLFGLTIETGYFESFDFHRILIIAVAVIGFFVIYYLIEKRKYNKLATEIQSFLNQNENDSYMNCEN